MTPEQHRLRIQDIERMLYKADYGMGMPRDPQRVKELQAALEQARLIAAAPDLLAALKALSAGLHDEIDMKAHIKAAEVRAARAAIAKAEGTS